jgi:tetratricopeptide (TPR) repeat protein
LTTRIDQLAPSQRVLLRDASVLGTTVDVGLLARVLDDPTAGEPDRWAPLATFVEGDDGGYRFLSALGQQAAYEGLPFRRRRWVHRRVGEALEGEPDSARHVATMALHFAAAGDHQRGWRYGAAAGEQASAAFANADAADSFELALREASFLRGLEPQRVAEVEERFGDVCDVLGRFDEAAALYRRARRRASSPRQLRKIGLMHERVGAYDKSIAWLRRGEHELRHATSADEIAERALMHASRAGLCYRVGDLFGALDFGIKAATDAQSAGDPHVLAKATLLLELVTSQLGFVGKSVELFHQSGDLNGEADARNNRGMAAYFHGDWETALADYEASGELFARTGDVVGAATSLNNIGEILSDQGRYAEAIAKFDEARHEFAAANYAMGVTVVIGNVARAEARAGNYDKALELFDVAIERFREMDSGAFARDQQIRRLECLLLAGRFDAAAAQEQVLVETLESSSPDAHVLAVAFRLRGWLAYARGDLEVAASLLAHSLAEASIADARYERAIGLLIAAEVERARGGDPTIMQREAATILDELGVIAVPGWMPSG